MNQARTDLREVFDTPKASPSPLTPRPQATAAGLRGIKFPIRDPQDPCRRPPAIPPPPRVLDQDNGYDNSARRH